MTFLGGKIFVFAQKISDDLFLVINQIFQIFPCFYQIFPIFAMLNVIFYPFVTRKTPFLLCSYLRANPTTLACFSKYWGDQCMSRPPTSNFGGNRPLSPPRSPPLHTQIEKQRQT